MRSSSLSRAAESERPSTASHSGALKRPSVERLEQEAPGVVVQRVEHLAREVVGDVAMVAVERAHAGLRLGQLPQPERGQVQPGRPALGPLDEQLDVLVVERDPLALDEQLARLVEPERELGGADLAERTAGAQASERQRRVGARRRHDRRVRRQVLDGVLERDQALVVADARAGRRARSRAARRTTRCR